MVATEASVAQTKANLFRRGAPASSGSGVPAVDESRSGASVVASALPTA